MALLIHWVLPREVLVKWAMLQMAHAKAGTADKWLLRHKVLIEGGG
jgi:hypothetical protein